MRVCSCVSLGNWIAVLRRRSFLLLERGYRAKMNKVSRLVSAACAVMLCFLLLPIPGGVSAQEPSASPEQAIAVMYYFSEPRVEKTWDVPPQKGALPLTEGYVSVTIEGLPQWSEPGLPILPFKTARVLLPYGLDVERITVTGGKKVTLPGSYIVEPGQKPVPLSHEGPLEVTPPNPDVYNSSTPYPGKLYSNETIQGKSGYRILLLNLHPVEYIPRQGQLSYYRSLTVQITLKAAAAAAGEWRHVRHLAGDEDTVRKMVDNPDQIKTYRSPSAALEQSSLLGPGYYEYVIITSEALAATPGPYNFQALRDEKISRGITATIITTEWIYANYPGTRPDGGEDNQTKIRNFITDAYNTWGTRYVLLGGDGDGADVGGESGDDIIPHRGFAAGGENDIAADMYYACLDGTFDHNANGIYGEPNDGPGGGEVDLLAEVYVGRAPVDSEAEVQNFVRKTLAYQNMPMTDENLRKVWMVGEYLGFGGVANWGGNYKDEIKDGSSAHGYTTVGFEDSPYAPGFDVSTLYDRDYPGHWWPASEIIGIINDNAHLINHLGHANVDYVMKMVNSDVDGLSNDELYFIGYSQGCYSGSFDNRTPGGDYTDYDCISEHLTTEPHGAVAFIANSRYGWGVWESTDGPSQHYDREFWDAVLGEDIFNIGIANQDSKEDNAGRVGDEIERWCYYEINLFGDPELAVKLYEGVVYDSHEIDDSSGGNGNGYPEPGESISMWVTLRNTSTNTTFSNVTATLSAASDPYITVRDDYEDYGDISPGGTATGPDTYDFTIGAGCPVGHMVTFSLNITASNGGPWADSFDLRVEGPDLVIADKWEEWVDEDAGTYKIHYVVKNLGYVTAPANHEAALTVDDTPVETQAVPVELAAGQEYEGVFDTIITLSERIDEVTVCADFDNVIEELSEENNCRTNTVLLWTEFITDPVGDQFYGYGPDIIGADFQLGETSIYFRVRTAEPIDPGDTVNYMLLDLDLDAQTGFVSNYPTIPTNDIGADGVAVIYPSYYGGMMAEQWSLPLRTADDKPQPQHSSTQALSLGLAGELDLWDPCYQGFYYAGNFPVFTDGDYFWFAIPLDMLEDDGIMSAVDVIGKSWEPTDVAPNDGHGITVEGPDLIIADTWEEWVDEDAGTYEVHYVVKNQGNQAVPAGHEAALTVDGDEIETKPVPVGLGPGEEYEDSFGTVLTFTPPDEITVCADYDGVVDEFSETNNCRTNMLFKDVVQLTTEPDWDGNPAITRTGDGTVWVVWNSYRSGGNGIWYKTSSEGGETWSEDSAVDLGGMWGYGPSITQTDDGRIWVTFTAYESGNADIWYVTSSDGGETWTPPSQITTDPGSDYDAAIMQANDGNIWVVWYSYRSGNANIWYKTSSDGGETWSEDYQLTTDPGWDTEPTITQTNDGTLWVVWQSYRYGGNGIWYKTSPDGGETWSADSPIDLGGMWGYEPAIAQTSDGIIWVVFSSWCWRSGNDDIWYTTSSDAGASWSRASRFTRFVGYDGDAAATALFSGHVALAWVSDRSANYDIWYGVIGLMEDINPPPYLYWAENEPRAPDTTQTVTVRACARDESGIEDVQLVWWVDGEPQDNLPMYDDGVHNDYGAGDGVYGSEEIGPFPLIGTVVQYRILITDIGGNAVLAPQYRYSFKVIKPFVKTADILLVADEYYYGGQYYQYYAEALDNLGYAYDVWDCGLRGNIDGDTLNQYLDGIVIWSTPDWGYIGYSETLDNLTSYLDNGGKLFISGQDIGWNIGWSSFYQDYLHARYVQDNIGLYCLNGTAGDPITDGLYVCISGDYGANNQYSPDEIDPISPAQTIFFYDTEATAPLSPIREPVMPTGRGAPGEYSMQRGPGTTIIESSGSGALRVDTGVYKVVYFAFGFEAINCAADRATVMQRVLRWLGAPAEEWRVPVSIGADIGSAEVTFGVNSLATDGYDEDYDYPAPPPPPTGVDAYFYYPDNPPLVRRLATSIVAPADSIIWPLRVMYKTELGAVQANNVTITWSPEDIGNVPAQYVTLTLTDDAGQELANLRTQSSYTFQAEPGVLYSFQIRASKLLCLELKAGWNMVSLPIDPGTTAPGEIFPGAAAIYTWNPDTKSYQRPSEILAGKGYWVLYFDDVTLCLGGTGIYGYNLSGGAGWHMIGGLFTDAEIIVGSGEVYGTLYHWDPQALRYVGRPLNDVRPGEGYWMLAFTDFSISVVPKPPAP
jgi:hypothetical protein